MDGKDLLNTEISRIIKEARNDDMQSNRSRKYI
jgi:hypothetical protein